MSLCGGDWIPEPISVNQEEQELRLMVSKRTTWLGSVPWLTATHTRGYSCSGTTNSSKTRKGLGNGKSKCCSTENDREVYKTEDTVMVFKSMAHNATLCLLFTFISMNLCIGSYHCNRTMPYCSAPHRYLNPVYGLRTERERERGWGKWGKTVFHMCFSDSSHVQVALEQVISALVHAIIWLLLLKVTTTGKH